MLAPGETTFFRLLKNISPEKLQEKLLACLDHLLGPVNPRRIIIDGNELRSSQGLQLVSAFCGETGRFLGARAVEEKSDEIPAARELLKECVKDGSMFLVDALHSQNKLARTSKRGYWDIENGAHQRLDCSRIQEDKSRVRTRNSAHNLGLFRRAALSLARHWIDHQPHARKATTNGFIATIRKDRSELAFRLVTSKPPKWLPSGISGII